MFEYNKQIEDSIFNSTEIKLMQFADDTKLFLNDSNDSLKARLNRLEIYGNISGFKVNTDKPKLD